MVSKEEGKISILRDATNGSSSINKKNIKKRNEKFIDHACCLFYFIHKMLWDHKKERRNVKKVSLSFNFVGFSVARGAAVVKNKVNGGTYDIRRFYWLTFRSFIVR